VAADVGEPLATREQGDKLAALLKSGRVKRADYASPVDQNFHFRLAATSGSVDAI
jgi:hypothetical protein